MMTCPGLGLARHAVGRVHGRAENVARLDDDRAEVTADADRDLLSLDLEVRVSGDRRLHFDGGVDRRVAIVEGRHDLVAHRLDDRAAVLFGGATHDLDADRDLVAGRDVAQDFEQPRAADDVGEEDREFLLLTHAPGASPVDYIIRIIGRKLAGRPNRVADMLEACSAGRRSMALSVEVSTAAIFRHVLARSHGRRLLYADAGSRGKAARRIAECCERHRLQCVVWSVTDRLLHLVVRGPPGRIAFATDELLGSRVRHGHCLSTQVNPDIYLLELARHALHAPVRGGLVRRAIDWPHSSARESFGLCAAPAWLDPTPLYDLLGPRDGKGSDRFRRFMDSS